MNIFCAARRIIAIVVVLISIGFLFHSYDTRPSYVMKYEKPGRAVSECKWGGSFPAEYVESPIYMRLFIVECAPEHYLDTANFYYATWTKNYTAPSADVAKAKDYGLQKFQERAWDLLLSYICTIVVLAGIVFAVGWVIRGLLGIPMGKDSKPL